MNLRSVTPFTIWLLVWTTLAGGSLLHGQGTSTPPTVVFSTRFEPEEGYDPKFSLGGQIDWVNLGSGGNGLITNFFDGFGQSAYVGFFPPTEKEESLHVLFPLELAPIKTNQNLITFSVLMQVTDSTNGKYDDFRWSVFNREGTRLFSLDFENSSLDISYGLDDKAGFISTGLSFDNQGAYELEIVMNLAHNLWNASLNGYILAHSKPITTIGTPLNLGDIDAVWVIRTPGSPGDNYMIFDNYTILAAEGPSIPPRIVPVGVLANGAFHLRVYGERNLNYVIESSGDLTRWDPIKVITAPSGGVFDFQDPDAIRLDHRYYRVWHRP